MKNIALLALAFILTTTLTAHASSQSVQIKKELEDTSAGEGFGGLSGMMVGAAAGGPIGALAGAVAGVFTGGKLQDVSGQSQKAYVVTQETGEDAWYRSPARDFEAGQQAQIVRGRLRDI